MKMYASWFACWMAFSITPALFAGQANEPALAEGVQIEKIVEKAICQEGFEAKQGEDDQKIEMIEIYRPENNPSTAKEVRDLLKAKQVAPDDKKSQDASGSLDSGTAAWTLLLVGILLYGIYYLLYVY